MRKRLLTWGTVLMVLAAGMANVATAPAAVAAEPTMAVIVHMAAQADLAAGIPEGNRAARGRAVIEALLATAATTQGPLTAFLEAEQAAGHVESFTSFWIFNGFAVRATPDVVAAIAARPDVASVTEDQLIQLPIPLPGQGEVGVNAPEPNIAKVKAPKVWLDFNNRGEGSLVGVLDTGADVSHPDLALRFLGGANSWRDFVNNQPNPYDDNGHGTHVSGTAVGDNAGGTDIGVAPKAKFIACKAFTAGGSGSTSAILQCMQFLLDPDGNPGTADFPHVVNNSWGTSPGCFRDFQAAVRAWVAAGIFPDFAAGNAGPGPSTGGSPGNYEESFAVGATDNNDNIAPFSSRGPSQCDNTIFPEVSAPGVGVRSAAPGGGYRILSGTSMATPHVAGCVALMQRGRDQVGKPAATVGQLRKWLKRTAVDLGAPGNDNDYGKGRINCFRAVKKARNAP